MIKYFIYDEDGVETMEWLTIVCVVAALIGVAVKCAGAIKEKMITVASYI